VYIAQYDYEAADPDEVGFVEGDRLINVTVIDDGWMSVGVRPLPIALRHTGAQIACIRLAAPTLTARCLIAHACTTPPPLSLSFPLTSLAASVCGVLM